MPSVRDKARRSIEKTAKIYVGEKYHTVRGGVGFFMILNAESGHERIARSDPHLSYSFDGKHRLKM